MNMDAAAIALMFQILNQVLIADTLNLTNSIEPFHDEGIQLKNNCVTNGLIVCDKGLVQIGICCTRASGLSGVVVYGLCPYIILTDQEVYDQYQYEDLFYSYYRINFSVPEQSCGALNRKGLLCSECYDGYGPAVYAFANECIKCYGNAFNRWALYFFVVLFPVTMFYIIVIVFNIRATSPPFTAYVLFCQSFAALDRIYYPGGTKYSIRDPSQVLLLLARTLSGIWNLDFGRYIIPPFCVSENISTYHALFLDYVPGFYPMVLIFFTCVLIELHGFNFKPVVLLWRPFHKCFVRARRTWDPKASMVNAFATFLLLSFSKILFVSCFSLQREYINTISHYCYMVHALFYNPNIDIHSYNNLPFVVLGFSLSTIFVIVPTMILFCYQFARKVSFCCCCCKPHILSMFLDTFQGHYKDGTNGTYDWRFLAGLYPLLRVVIVYNVHKHKLLARNSIPPQMQYYFVVVVIVAFVRPYKRFFHNLTETFLLILIMCMMWNASAFQRIAYSQNDRIKIAVLQLVPHSFLAIVIVFKVAKLLLQKLNLKYKGRPIVDKLSLSCLEKNWSRLNGMFSNNSELPSITADLPTQSYGTIN